MSADIVAFVCFILGLISGAVGVTLSGRPSAEMARDTTHRLPPPPRQAPPMPTVKPPMQHEGKHYNLIDRDILRLLMAQGSLSEDEIKDLLTEGRISVNDVREAEAKRSQLFGAS